MLDNKLDPKNIALLEMIGNLRDHLDIYQIVGLNANAINASDFSSALAVYLQASALEGLALYLSKIYEAPKHNDLNSIPGIIDSLPMRTPTKKQLKLLKEFGERYSKAAEPTEIKSYLARTFKLFSCHHQSTLICLKDYRDKIGAHSDHKADIKALPSQAEFDDLFKFAFDFYELVARAIIGVHPASVPRRVRQGLIRTLKAFGVQEPQSDFAPNG